MKACIFGPGGYLGTALARTLEARGNAVQRVSSRAGGIDQASGLLPPSVQVEDGTDVVYYLSQSPHYRQVPDAAPHLLAVNCVAAVQAAASAARVGARRFIYASTGNVYAPAFHALAEDATVRRDAWYPLSKLMGEEGIAMFRGRMDVTALRIFGIYGPGQQDKLVPMLAASVREGRPVFAERNPHDASDAGGLRFSPIYIDDAVDVLLALAAVGAAAPPVLNLAGDRTLSVAEIAQAIGRTLGVTPSVSLAERARQTDLVADIGLLQRVAAPRFTPFEQGLAAMLTAAG